MRYGFVKVAAVTPDMRVADVDYNKKQIFSCLDEALSNKAKIIVFPELCITGYTCGDLFYQDILLERAKAAIYDIASYTKGKDALVFVGTPWVVSGELYNTAAVLNDGKLIGLVTKTFLPNYAEFYEMRQFIPGPNMPIMKQIDHAVIPFGPKILFQADCMKDLIVAAEICEDVWSPVPPSIEAAISGATIVVNCSASDEAVGKDAYRETLIKGQSARLISGYIYANAGVGESTTDVVFGGHNIIVENGSVITASKRFVNGIIYGEIDVHRLAGERRRNTTFRMNVQDTLPKVVFHIEQEDTVLTRKIPMSPFVPEAEKERKKACEEVLMIQTMGLKKRMLHTHTQKLVLGISGGLDSTLALLVCARTMDALGIERQNIVSVTMPCFGTTDRTYQNACALTKYLGATLREIPIEEAVTVHFKDIGHNMNDHSVTYENAQARERTQVLMDIANQEHALVIGTGDMSELALGWATYNGDHMSMYGVNCSVPKTFIRYLVSYYADTCGREELRQALYDVLDTPVSPELLPPKEGQIAQKTEDLVGPYELHDFYLYYMLRFGFEPRKIRMLANYAFAGVYEEDIIYKWLETFYKRFFMQQFKRSCLPDGPKVGSIGLSPRGDLRMPSDSCYEVWMQDLKSI